MDLFHIGPQKTGRTWIYRCLREHPEVYCPSTDLIHYYDMFYARGAEWYGSFFEGARPDQVRFDPTPTYVRSPWAARRMSCDRLDARIMITLRDPVERAVSHFWHERKKGKISFRFEEVLSNYDLFASWIEPGFYAEHLERFFEYFPREQVLCLFFDELRADPEGYLRRICRFAGIDSSHSPSVLHRRVNVAGGRRTLVNRAWRKLGSLMERVRLDGLHRKVEQRLPGLRSLVRDRSEYEGGVDSETRRCLQTICEPEIRRVEDLLDVDLSAWRHRDVERPNHDAEK